MRRNRDPAIIVMDRDLFDALLIYGSVGAREAGAGYAGVEFSSIERHIRKYNLEYGAEQTAYRRAEEDKLKQQRTKTKDILNTMVGKTIYYRKSVWGGRPEDRGFAAVQCLGPGKSKTSIRIKLAALPQRSFNILLPETPYDISINNLEKELPPNFELKPDGYYAFNTRIGVTE